MTREHMTNTIVTRRATTRQVLLALLERWHRLHGLTFEESLRRIYDAVVEGRRVTA